MRGFMKRDGIAFFLLIFLASACQSRSFTPSVHSQELNKDVLLFASQNLGNRVGRGECWDLAAEPLRKNRAAWDGALVFGKLVAHGDRNGHSIDEQIKPGDIIQYRNVTLKGKHYTQYFGFPDHTAIIKKVESRLKFSVFEQNVDKKRFVTENNVDLNDISKGSYKIYRPFTNHYRE